MKEGLLWLDTDKQRPFTVKVQRAVEYYESKYGHLPELCMVNGQSLDADIDVGGVRVRPATNITPHHFWLGMRAKEAPATAAS